MRADLTSDADIGFPSINAIVLSRFECLQWHEGNDGGEEQHTLEIAVAPARAEQHPDRLFTFVLCKCSRRAEIGEDESAVVQFTAVYSVLFSMPGFSASADLGDTYDNFLATAVFANFKNLFAIANTQMATRMPDLPFGPVNVSKKSIDYVLSAFDEDEDHTD